MFMFDAHACVCVCVCEGHHHKNLKPDINVQIKLLSQRLEETEFAQLFCQFFPKREIPLNLRCRPRSTYITLARSSFSFQYSTLLFVVFVCEVLTALFAYHSRQSVASAFHDGLSRGLAEYGKDYKDRTEAIDDIQSAVGRIRRREGLARFALG